MVYFDTTFYSDCVSHHCFNFSHLFALVTKSDLREATTSLLLYAYFLSDDDDDDNNNNDDDNNNNNSIFITTL